MKRICILLSIVCLAMCGAALQAQVTSFTLSGDPGDYISGGQFLFFTPADGTFNAYQNYDQGVSVSFNSANYDHFWYLDFAAPNNQPLTVGTYTGATRFPFQASNEPGLSVAGDGRGCNMDNGSFTVLEVTYGANGTIDSFDAIFEQHCEGLPPAARGEIRYNAHPTVTVTAPARLTTTETQSVHFTVTATDAASRHVTLSATGVPAGATFIDNGDNTGTFDWPSSVAGSYVLTFQGDNLSGNIGATYTQIDVTAQNDDFDNATVIPSLPFTKTQEVGSATESPDDPYTCTSRSQTVWYAFTPTASMRLEANTFGSNYDSVLAVFTGSRGALTQIACDDDANGTLQSRVRFDAVAGTTYYFMAASLYPMSSPTLVFNLLQGPPPLTLVPSVTQFGTVNPSTGTATVSGFINTSQQVYVTVSGQIKQMHGGTPITGFFSVFVPCNAGNNPWSITVDSVGNLFHGRSSALFTGGKAMVSGIASAFDPETGEEIERPISATITLRGKK
jgi:VCBS repeat-containing protein